MDRAAALVRNIRIVKPQPVPLIARLLRQLFNDQVRQPCQSAVIPGIEQREDFVTGDKRQPGLHHPRHLRREQTTAAIGRQ